MEKKDIQRMPYISKTALGKALNKPNLNTLRNYISYWQKKEELLPVKRGFYVFKNFIDKSDNSLYYARFLGTKLIEPSYLSAEFILQEYQALTDVVFGYSLMTTKKTTTIKNQFGSFNYYSIDPGLFSGFEKKKYGDMIWYEATKARALFDFLRLKLRKKKIVSGNDILDLRINFEVFTKQDWLEFEKYLNLAGKKMQIVYKLIKLIEHK
ncbi:MAG: hypothetical protein WCK16_00295 [Candidatus Moraniibacteriota bacterium]